VEGRKEKERRKGDRERLHSHAAFLKKFNFLFSYLPLKED
jgi:hypothetical protein